MQYQANPNNSKRENVCIHRIFICFRAVICSFQNSFYGLPSIECKILKQLFDLQPLYMNTKNIAFGEMPDAQPDCVSCLLATCVRFSTQGITIGCYLIMHRAFA